MRQRFHVPRYPRNLNLKVEYLITATMDATIFSRSSPSVGDDGFERISFWRIISAQLAKKMSAPGAQSCSESGN